MAGLEKAGPQIICKRRLKILSDCENTPTFIPCSLIIGIGIKTHTFYNLKGQLPRTYLFFTGPELFHARTLRTAHNTEQEISINWGSC